MNEKETHDNDDIEEELAEGEYEEPLPKFGDDPNSGDEMEYSSFGKERNGGFLSRFFKLPRLSIGWLGVVLVILILLFLLVPKPKRISENGRILSLSTRLENLEGQVSSLEKVYQKLAQDESDSAAGKQIIDRIDKLESLLALKTSRLEKNIEDLKKNAARTKVMPPSEKPKVKEPEKSTEIEYHIVRKGENLYRIALRYGTKESELIKLNNLKQGAVIYPGQKLRIKE